MHLSGLARKVPSALAGPSAEAGQRAFGLPPRCGLIEHDEGRRADYQRRRPHLVVPFDHWPTLAPITLATLAHECHLC